MFPSYNEWLSELSDTERAQAEQLVAAFSSYGCSNPQSWARSEISENIPQLARFILVRHIWTSEIDRWRSDPERWIAAIIAASTKRPKDSFADAGPALQRLLDAGGNAADIATVARRVAYDVVCGVLNDIDGDIELDSDDAPRWALMEVDPSGRLTGRVVGSLNESILEGDPTGREGRPAE